MSDELMSDERASFRAGHIKQAIERTRDLLAGKSIDDVRESPDTQAALERYLEIVSEASRYIPATWRQVHGGGISWKQIADLGNILRHAYNKTDLDLLWSVYLNDLDPLESAVDSMLAAHPMVGEED